MFGSYTGRQGESFEDALTKVCPLNLDSSRLDVHGYEMSEACRYVPYQSQESLFSCCRVPLLAICLQAPVMSP